MGSYNSSNDPNGHGGILISILLVIFGLTAVWAVIWGGVQDRRQEAALEKASHEPITLAQVKQMGLVNRSSVSHHVTPDPSVPGSKHLDWSVTFAIGNPTDKPHRVRLCGPYIVTKYAGERSNTGDDSCHEFELKGHRRDSAKDGGEVTYGSQDDAKLLSLNWTVRIISVDGHPVRYKHKL
jgi:hypothetical protein